MFKTDCEYAVIPKGRSWGIITIQQIFRNKTLYLSAQATTVITTDQGLRGGRVIELKKTVDEAMKQCPAVERVFMSQRTGASVPIGNKDIILEEVCDGNIYRQFWHFGAFTYMMAIANTF